MRTRVCMVRVELGVRLHLSAITITIVLKV